MTDLAHEIAKIIQRWDADYGGSEVPAAAILALPEIAEALLAKKAMDRIEATFAVGRPE